MSSENDAAVDELAGTARLLVALDFDGTLSPLVSEPMTARMLPEARTALERLAALPDTAVALVSGRTLADLRVIAEHDDDSVFFLAGSHGAQYWEPETGATEPEDAGEDAALRDELERLATEAVEGLDGVWIESKAFGFGVHTRRADRATAERANRVVDDLVAERAPGWRRRAGHDILEFSFRHEGKDAAVQRLRERTRATGVLFAGDDVTDEDALRSLGPGDLGVRVGEAETAASVSVADIPAFVALLDRLALSRGAALDRPAESRASQPE